MILHADPEKRPKEDAKAIVIEIPYSNYGVTISKGMYLLECVDGWYQLHYENGERSFLRLHIDWLEKLKGHIKNGK